MEQNNWKITGEKGPTMEQNQDKLQNPEEW